jgi:magnesium transporter
VTCVSRSQVAPESNVGYIEPLVTFFKVGSSFNPGKKKTDPGVALILSLTFSLSLSLRGITMGFAGWPLGLFLSAISSIFGILGKLFLKLAHNQRELDEDDHLLHEYDAVRDTTTTTTDDEDDDRERDSPQRSRLWYTYFYAGLLSMLVLNPALGAAAYSFASQSLLAPMAGLTIGWNTLMGPLLLPHERLTTHDFIGALLIFAGCVLVGVSGTHEPPPLPVSQLTQRFVSVPFLLYTIAAAGCFILLFHQSKDALRVSWSEAASKRSSSTPKGMRAVSHRNKADLSQVSRVALSVLAGVTSGQLFFLAAAMRIAKQGNAAHIWAYPVTYVCIAGALSTALAGLYLLNAALKVEDAVVVIYLYEASYILSGAVSGLCFFQDMNDLGAWHFVVYSLSLMLILLGIYVVASRNGGVLTYEDEENLLPLLSAPPSMTDVTNKQLFRKASYYASRSPTRSRSASYRQFSDDQDDASLRNDKNRRNSYPAIPSRLG